MPSLIDRFNSLINRLRPSSASTTSDETTSRRAGHSTNDAVMELRLQSDRRSVVNAGRESYKEDARTRGVISTLARDAVKGGFTVVINDATDEARAQELADDLAKRLKLTSRLDDWVRLSFRDGDSFLELSVDTEALIQHVSRKPTLLMHRNSDKTDRFADPTQAYWLADESVFSFGPPADATWFADWQIIHARWDHDEGERYGQPLFASARKSYKYASDGENDIWVRRRTRAGIKYVHKVEGDQTAVQAYIDRNADTLNNPKAAIQDFYGNVEIKAVQGDARLQEIGDVEHHIDTWAIASPVPLQLIGYGKNLNRDILEQKLEQYQETLRQVSEWVSDQIIKPLIETQWLLMGLWPGNIDYEIQWASKRQVTAAELEHVAKAGLIMQQLGWPSEEIINILTPLIPGLDAQRLLDAIAQQKASQPDEIARMAADASST